MTDKQLLELAANATGHLWKWVTCPKYGALKVPGMHLFDAASKVDLWPGWNPIADEGDRYRLARDLGMTIDFADRTVYKRLPDQTLIQEYWGGDFDDEGHAVARVAAEIFKAAPALSVSVLHE